jgi:hypothetical protein
VYPEEDAAADDCVENSTPAEDADEGAATKEVAPAPHFRKEIVLRLSGSRCAERKLANCGRRACLSVSTVAVASSETK